MVNYTEGEYPKAVWSILICLIFFESLSFARNDISDYFGVWKGEAFYGGKEYQVYVSFPGLGEASSGYYKANEKKNKKVGYNGYFWVKQEKEKFYKAKIRTGVNKFKTFLLPVEGKLENGEIFLDSFMVKGTIKIENVDTALFSFVNDFGQIRGKLKRLEVKKEKVKKTSEKHKTLKPEKINTSLKKKDLD